MINEPEDNLKGMLGKEDFAIPENYFEQLNRDIQTRLVEERLKALVVSPGFTVPELYFQALHQDMETRVGEEKLRANVTASGFTVPDLYFEQLHSKIELGVQSAPAQPTAKIISLWRSDVFKYATAACFIMLTAFGFYFNNNRVSKPISNTEIANEQLLFDIDEQLIIDDVAKKPVLKSNTTVSEEDLEAYILSNYSTNEIAANY